MWHPGGLATTANRRGDWHPVGDVVTVGLTVDESLLASVARFALDAMRVNPAAELSADASASGEAPDRADLPALGLPTSATRAGRNGTACGMQLNVLS